MCRHNDRVIAFLCIWGLCLAFGFLINTFRRRRNGHHFPDHNFKCIFLMKMCEFQLKFHWSLFPRVQSTIFQYWFRQWLGAKYASIHYLNQRWIRFLMHICITQPQWVNLSGAKTGIFSDNYVDTMTADVLAHYVTRSSETTVLTIQDDLVLLFYVVGFDVPALTYC